MESESESSLDGGSTLPSGPESREQLQKRIESLTQENKVLKTELDTFKIKCKVLQEENRTIKQTSVINQAKVEQEEEYISNTLLRKIQILKKEKETLAHHYECEEECLTNDLSRKLEKLRQEKCKLEQTLEQEQECLVNKLMRKIEKLQAETDNKQTNLDKLRREMIELENTLEQEQEALVNKLWKRMDKLETEKRSLQIKLEQPVSDPSSSRDITNVDSATANNLSEHVQTLRSEVLVLRANLAAAQKEKTIKMQQFAREEKSIREENKRLQCKLKLEVERREALCRHLSESESSLEMDEERFYKANINDGAVSATVLSNSPNAHRQRTINSPVSHSPSNSRHLSPGSLQQNRCNTCGQLVNRRASERFIKPALSTPMLGLKASAPNLSCESIITNNTCVNGGGGNSGDLYSGGITAPTGAFIGNINSRVGDRLTGSSGIPTDPLSLMPGSNNNNLSINLNTSSNSVNFMNVDNSSLSAFTPTNTTNTNTTTFAQPASPMDTSVCKDNCLQ